MCDLKTEENGQLSIVILNLRFSVSMGSSALSLCNGLLYVNLLACFTYTPYLALSSVALKTL